MKANVLHGIGDMRYEDVAIPTLKENEVLVNVKAAGICGSDIARTFKNGTYHFPTIIGHEFSGQVVKTFNDSYPNLVGKRVAVFPLIPCFECEQCKQRIYECCSNYNYLGSRCDGGFAEYVAVPQWNIVQLPDNVSYEEAAMLEPACVAYHTLSRTSISTDNTVAIVGPGTIGMILCQLAQHQFSAKTTYLIGRTKAKLKFAMDMGFTSNVINSTTMDVEQEILKGTHGHGVDIAIEGTGASSGLTTCLDIVKSCGTIVSMGNPSSDITLAQKEYWKVLRKQITLRGTWNSHFSTHNSDWQSVIQLLAQQKISLKPLITHRFPLSELKVGLDIMKTNKEYYNKIMICNE